MKEARTGPDDDNVLESIKLPIVALAVDRSKHTRYDTFVLTCDGPLWMRSVEGSRNLYVV